MHFRFMSEDFKRELCFYIYKHFRLKYKSNREFADAANINEKVVRLIQQGEYNLTIKKFKQICDSQNIKMSSVMKDLGE